MKRIFLSPLRIRQRLPLVICSLLLTAITIFGVISYLGVRKATLKAGQTRMLSLSQQLSDMMSTSAHHLASGAYTESNNPAIANFLQSQGKDSVTETKTLLGELLRDTNYVAVRILDLAGRTMQKAATARVELPLPNSEIESLALHKHDSALLGNMYCVGSVVYYPILAAIKNNNSTIGYMVKWRKLQTRTRSVDQFSRLIGTDAKLYLGNADGSLWTNMSSPVEAPPKNNGNKNQILQYSRSGREVFATLNPVAKSPWVLSVEFSKSTLLQTATNFVYWLLIGGGIILMAGIFFAWLLARNLTGPLVKLTRASSQMASGNYAAQVPVDRLDEIGKLARSFNAMATQVQHSKIQLEERAENYKLLFEKNPMPMWIMSATTLYMLEVNEAATSHYGYSKEEFLKLNAKELRPEEDIPRFINTITTGTAARKKHGIWRHRKKNGSIIMVDMTTDIIRYNNEEAILVLSNDVTEKLKAEAELVRHRNIHQEIITETKIRAREQEREELGKELHDNINQILASTKLYLELARTGNKNLLQDAIEKSYANINFAIGEIRKLSKELVGPVFDRSLKDSLQQLTKELEAITPIHITFDANGFDEAEVDENIKVMIYRVVQEQLNNILKHAAASEVRIVIKTSCGTLQFSIEDNGVGFDVTKKPEGIGLRNIDDRVKLHQGKFDIQSSPGDGCRIAIEVPLHNPGCSTFTHEFNEPFPGTKPF